MSLSPCKQRISDDGRLRYMGGELPLAGGLAERARALAERALAAMPPAIGYVGVDLVLGRAPDGSEDVVIEINPRLTTSYVGLRAAAKSNLAKAMWSVAQGETQQVEFADRPIEFDSSGNVSYHAMTWLGLDIGGANLKAATAAGWAHSLAFCAVARSAGLGRGACCAR